MNNDSTKLYRLEVISTADGFVDYDDVVVNVNQYRIISIYPNPASSQVTIQYDVNGATNSTLQILQPYNSTPIASFQLDSNQASQGLNITGINPGIYTIVLNCNGITYDAKSIQIY